MGPIAENCLNPPTPKPGGQDPGIDRIGQNQEASGTGLGNAGLAQQTMMNMQTETAQTAGPRHRTAPLAGDQQAARPMRRQSRGLR